MTRFPFTHGAGLLLGLAATAPPVVAQSEAPVNASSCAASITPPSACFRELESRRRAGDGKARAPDHRYEGMAIGGGLGLIGGALLGLAFCGQSDDTDTSPAQCALVGGLGMGVLAGFVGMMIGAQFPKEDAGTNEQPVPSDSVSQ